MSPRSISSLLLAFTLLLCPASSRAAPADAFARLIAGDRAAEFLFYETSQGSRIRTLIGDQLENARMLQVRSELEARVAHIRDTVKPETEKLTLEDRIQLKILAQRELRINPEWHEGKESTDFFEPSSRNDLKNKEAEFKANRRDPSLPSRNTKETEMHRTEGRSWIKGKLKEMSDCRAAMPAEEASSTNSRYLITQLLSDEASTFAGAVIAAGGWDDVDWNSLPVDLAQEAMASMGGSRLTWSKGSVNLRWFRVAGFGVGQSAATAVLYYFSPSTETHGKERMQATVGQFEFNSAFYAGYAYPQIKLYELVKGLECLYPTGRGAKAVLGFQLGTGVAANVAYFGFRKMVFGTTAD